MKHATFNLSFWICGEGKILQSLHQNIAGGKSRRLPTHSGAIPDIPGEEQCWSLQSASYTALNQLNTVL